MTNPIIKIHNITTGEVIEREMNAEELAQLTLDKAVSETRTRTIEETEVKRQALLDRLGITAEEAKLLLN